MAGSLVVLTGASGVGKTAVAGEVQRRRPDIAVLRFDSVGVPSAEVMASYGTDHQPGGAWQRAMTLQWIERIAPILNEGRPVLLEGQMRIAFIQEALETHNVSRAQIVLIECNDSVRNARLISERGQPELASQSMSGWSRYLHEEALQAGCEIVDTSTLPLTELADMIASRLQD